MVRVGRESEELPHGGGVRRDGTDAATADVEPERLAVGTTDRAGNRTGGGARYSHGDARGGGGVNCGGRAISQVRVEGRRWSQQAGEGTAAG